MVQWKEKDDKKQNLVKFIGVLTQFCLLSVSKKQKITIKLIKQMRQKSTKQNTKNKKRSQHVLRPRDKLIKGLGVSLAKTPLN